MRSGAARSVALFFCRTGFWGLVDLVFGWLAPLEIVWLVGGREAGFFRQRRTLRRIVVSIRPGWVRNYLTYFFVYSARR